MQQNLDYDMQQGYGGGHMGMGGAMTSSDTALIPDVSKAIVGEVHAYHFYQKLAELAPNEQDRQTILGIQRDEAKHYHWFSMILQRLGGQQPEIPPGELPTSYKEGLKMAIRDELEAVAFYQDIASRATDPRIHMHFMHASHDEQRHAAWLQFMLTNLQQ